MFKCPKKNKTYTILIFVQVYSNNLWVNFGLQNLRISKNSKMENCRYLSHSSNPSSLVSIGFLSREIRPKYWSVLKSDFSFSDSASLISFLIWSFQSWQSILALQMHLLRHLSMVLWLHFNSNLASIASQISVNSFFSHDFLKVENYIQWIASYSKNYVMINNRD